MSAMKTSAMNRSPRWALALAVVLSGAWSCMGATDVELLEVLGTGVLFGQVYVDRNGNGAADAQDTALVNAQVVLLAEGTQQVVDEATTDSLGIFLMTDVPVGAYTLEVAAAALGDSLVALAAGRSVTVKVGDTTPVVLGVSYPYLTLEEVRAAAAGRRVFTSGIVLNPRQPNGDGRVFFKEPSAYLQATNVERATLAIGDSVRVLGRTAVSNGMPTLDVARPFVLVSQAQLPIPVEVTTGVAATASGATLDAALVRIRNADITDTSTVANDFYFWAHNGGDSVEVVFRSFLSIPTSPVRPDTVVRVSQAVGLLSPFDDGSGTPRWRLLVRAASEIAYDFKQANVGVTTAYDTAQASVGDTVEIRVTVGNVGPQTATGVSVADTVPAALTYVPGSATATRGSYDPVTHLWSVGDLMMGVPADTLRIRVEVTGAPGAVSNRAWLRPLTREIEINAANNQAATTLTIQ